MTGKELVKEIESNGGSLTVLADGVLRWKNIAPHLLAQVTPLKAEIVAILRKREEPPQWTGLFTREELTELNEKYRAGLDAERLKRFNQMQADRQQAESARSETEFAILREIVQDFPDVTVAELAQGSGRTVSSIRRSLRKARITLASANIRDGVQP